MSAPRFRIAAPFKGDPLAPRQLTLKAELKRLLATAAQECRDRFNVRRAASHIKCSWR